MTDIRNSKFWEWHCKQRIRDLEEINKQRAEALSLLEASVRDGDITSLDGVESPLSLSIKKHFGTSKFEMNSLWIGADQKWTCPCCGRTKYEITRLGRSGQILAKLVVHHDHMGDAMQEAFHSAFANAGTEVAQVDGFKLVERMGSAFAAFTNTLICEDCNHADVLATKHINSPSYFSFSVGQIRQFIRSRAHTTHQVNYDIVDQIWAKAKAAYDLRMDLIQKVAEASATDSHWYEPTHPTIDPTPTFELSRRRLGDLAIKEWVSAEDLFRALGPRSSFAVRDYSKWRKAKPKLAKPLPVNYLAMLRSEPTFARRWDELPDDWKCPICERNKIEVVYVAEKGKITLVIHSHHGVGKWQNSSLFCVNCMTVLLGLKREVEALAGIKLKSSYDFVSPLEIAKIIIPEPHISHKVNGAAAEALLQIILTRQLV